MKSNRRQFIKASLAASGIAVAGFSSCTEKKTSGEKSRSFTLGMASYTFRSFDTETAFAMTKRLQLEKIALKSFHLPLDADEALIRKTAAKAKEYGLDLYGCGVIYMKTADEVRRAFQYAKAGGMRVIIGVPNYEFLPLAEEMVQKTGIKLAIHNHGPGDALYPSPRTAYEKISSLDAGVGLCIDVGHTERNGESPADAVRELKDRIHDIHIKDVSASSGEGGTLEIGRGVVDIPDLMDAIISSGYNGALSFEYEKDSEDPLPGVSESVGYVRGVLSMM